MIFSAQCRGMQPRVLDRESGERPMKRGPIGAHQQIFQASRAAQVFHRKVTGIYITVIEPGRDAASVVDLGKTRKACPIGEEVAGVLRVYQLLDDDWANLGWSAPHLIACNPAADAVFHQKRVVQGGSSAVRSS